MTPLLAVKNLNVVVGGKAILKKFSLEIMPGELHVLMGPNGSGKSTLAYTLMGHPGYTATNGTMTLAGRPLKKLSPDKRARLGLFLGFQYPLSIAGLSINTLLPEIARSKKPERLPRTRKKFGSLAGAIAVEQKKQNEKLRRDIAGYMKTVGLPEEMLYRSLNENFSGGEKKKSEMLQMLSLKPRLAILDEPDSGLDVDAVKNIAGAVKTAQCQGTAILLITHYPRLLKYLQPDKVHILLPGRTLRSGDASLADTIERHGYQNLKIRA